jgi:hypothetical protein
MNHAGGTEFSGKMPAVQSTMHPASVSYAILFP